MRKPNDGWHLNQGVSVGVIVALLIQAGVILIAGGQLIERVENNSASIMENHVEINALQFETYSAADGDRFEKRLEKQVEAVQDGVSQNSQKLDRLIDRLLDERRPRQ